MRAVSGADRLAVSDYGGGWRGDWRVLTRHAEGRSRKRNPVIVPCVEAAKRASKNPALRFATSEPGLYGWGLSGYVVQKRYVEAVKRRVGAGGSWHENRVVRTPILVYVLDGEVRGIVAAVRL